MIEVFYLDIITLETFYIDACTKVFDISKNLQSSWYNWCDITMINRSLQYLVVVKYLSQYMSCKPERIFLNTHNTGFLLLSVNNITCICVCFSIALILYSLYV